MSRSSEKSSGWRPGRQHSVLSAALCLLIFSLCACSRGRTVVYSCFVDIPSGGWPADEFCMFNTAELDSALFTDKSARYDVILAIRHTDDCPYGRLYLPVSQSSVDCPPLPDTLRVQLTDASDSWLGRYSKGIYTLTDTLMRDVPLPPLYSLKVSQAIPGKSLPGVLGVGLIITLNNP